EEAEDEQEADAPRQHLSEDGGLLTEEPDGGGGDEQRRVDPDPAQHRTEEGEAHLHGGLPDLGDEAGHPDPIAEGDDEGGDHAASQDSTGPRPAPSSTSGTPGASSRPAPGSYLRNLLVRRSASGLPPVWHVAQYCSDESAKLTSRTTSPQTGQASPARPWTRIPARLASLSSLAGLPEAVATASVRVVRRAS